MKNFYIKTYGCQMNVYDSMIMDRISTNLGYTKVSEIKQADVVIFNTCHIREKATEKLYSDLGRVKLVAKTQNRKIITVVAGCVAQAEGELIKERSKNVDLVIGPQSIHSLPELLVKLDRQYGDCIKLDFDPVAKFDYIRDELHNDGYGHGVSEFVSIQEGCDKFCTYCVVPYTRGAEYSRSVEEVYQESKRLVDSGVKEICFLGQNVNAYHGDYNGEVYNLGDLISYISSRLPALCRIRYTTSHPLDMHDSLYHVHQHDPKVMPYLHLPIQSGSNAILSRMNRKHNTEQYLKVITKMRQLRPDIAFSSDFIVGFPGETDKDFNDTLELVKNVKYASAYSFKYSPRPGTPGAEYSDQIDEAIKNERLQVLQSLLKQQQLEYNISMIGQEMDILFDRKKNNQVIARTPYMQSIYSDDESLYGKIVRIRVLEAFQSTLKGTILNHICKQDS